MKIVLIIFLLDSSNRVNLFRSGRYSYWHVIESPCMLEHWNLLDKACILGINRLSILVLFIPCSLFQLMNLPSSAKVLCRYRTACVHDLFQATTISLNKSKQNAVKSNSGTQFWDANFGSPMHFLFWNIIRNWIASDVFR